MISIDGLSLEFGGFTLLNNISFLLKPTDRIGLVGKNGAGKSTLLKLMMGIQSPSKGQVVTQKSLKVGYLPQELDCVNDKSVFEEVRTAMQEVLHIQAKLDQVQEQIATRTDYESDAYMQLLDDMDQLNTKLVNAGAMNVDADIEKILLGLGFTRERFTQHTSELSGGWRMRVELAKILIVKPDVLLLDEPTNHLDIESIQWFESFLKNSKIALLMISHDRRFLDSITNRTIEISLGRIHDYACAYTQYLEQRAMRMEQQIASYKNQQKLIKENQEFIERFRYKASKSTQVQSRVKMLEKLDIIEVDEVENISIKIRFADFKPPGILIFEATNLAKSYGKIQVLEEVDFRLERGEKVAFLGKNGEGKSTLVKIMTQQLEASGELKHGHQVNIGYFAQDQANKLDPTKTVFETIDDIATGDYRTKVRDILGAFLFGAEDIDKKVSVLSGGEKTRLALIALLLKPYNVLVLDEPTNHLDLTTKELLKEALKSYPGTVVLVSHDRHFLEGLCDKLYVFKNKKVKEHIGSIENFLKSLHKEPAKSLKATAGTTKASKPSKPVSKGSNKASYEQRKAVEKEIRQFQKKQDKAEKQIEQLENQVAQVELQLVEAYDAELYNQHQALKKELDSTLSAWEEAAAKVDELQEKKEAL